MKLNFKQFGAGYPTVILHGLFGTLDNWQTIAKDLAEEYLIYIIDQRNHGRSPHCDSISYPLMAEDLKQFLEDNWIYEANIIGHSMGGKTAMQFAIQYPEMVKNLVVVDIAPKAYEGGHQEIFEALLDIDLPSIESRKEADEKLGERIKDFGVRQFLLKNLTRTKEGNYSWKMNLPIIHKDYQNILSKIEGRPFEKPTLFLRGEQSNYIQADDEDEIKALFPRADIRTIKGAGHWVHAEKPQLLLAEVLSFLGDSTSSK